MQITVAMTCYNSEKFIEEAIKSITKQSYKDWELVIVDDCSTDNSQIVIKRCIEKFKIAKKVKLITHLVNTGCGKSLLDAIAGGNGSLVAIVDSDDALANTDAFKIMIKAHEDNPKASLCYSTYYSYVNNLKKVKVVRPIPKGGTYLRCLLKKGKRIRVSHLKVFKRRLYDKTEGVNPTLTRSVDKDLVLKLEEVGELKFIPKSLYFRRTHPESLTSLFHKQPIQDQWEVRRDKVKFIQDAWRRRKLRDSSKYLRLTPSKKKEFFRKNKDH